jgi:hypothetical protein
MKAAKSSIWDLYNGAKQYVVPLFQRPYVWSRHQWDQLWSDIIEQYSIQSGKPREKIPDRFLGSIVVVREYEKNLDKYTIIDGQQRITTISIILAVIRAFAKERNLKELYEQISGFLLNSPRSGEGQYVVIPTQVDKAALYNIFNEDYNFEKDSRIVECFDFFWRKIDEATRINILTLQQVITDDLCVVYIELDQGENPNQVFEALNYRGVPLEESDLIRNFFFASFETPEIAEVQYDRFWKPMEDRFENQQERISRFLRHFYMKDGKSIRIGEMFETIRKIYIDAPPEEIRILLRDMNRYSNYYFQLIHPEMTPFGDEISEKNRQHLIRIRVLGADAASPFLMNCLAWNDETGTDGKLMSDDDLERVLGQFESYLIRRAICRRSENGYEEIFGRFCSTISPGDTNVPEEVAALLVRLEEPYRMPDDNEFDDHLRNSDLYQPEGDNTIVWIILTVLEDYFSTESPGSESLIGVDLFDNGPKEQMIDHIMPCTLSPWWQNHLGPNWQALHQDYLHRLGNLTLTMDNPAILNADFDTKKAWYVLDNHMLNSTMKSIRQWRKFQIDQRSGVLAAFCKKIWAYYIPTLLRSSGHEEIAQGLRSGEIPKLAKPSLVTIHGTEYPVKFWYQVLEVTVRTIYEYEPLKFERIIREWPGYFSRDPHAFQSSVGPYSFKSRFGRYQIRDMCIAMVRLIGWSDDSWSLRLI